MSRLIVIGIALALLHHGADATAPNASSSTATIFSKSSFWYTPIPRDAPLNENSDRYVAEFQRQVKAYYGGVSINTWSFASPVFIAAADTPVGRVVEWDCQRKGFADRELAAQWQDVPIPKVAEAAVGSDAEMTIYQPESDTLWEFWRARKVDGQWQACWGGRMQHVSHSDGIWPAHYGATATGLPFLGGQISAEELQRGEIHHVIGIALVDTERAGVVSWPANRSDGYNPNGAANRIPEGLRFRLDPAVNVESLNLHPIAKIIARAAQQYGFVVWDKAGAITLRVHNPLTYTARGETDPYPALFAGTPAYAVLKGFPWNRLQFLPLHFGRQ